MHKYLTLANEVETSVNYIIAHFDVNMKYNKLEYYTYRVVIRCCWCSTMVRLTIFSSRGSLGNFILPSTHHTTTPTSPVSRTTTPTSSTSTTMMMITIPLDISRMRGSRGSYISGCASWRTSIDSSFITANRAPPSGMPLYSWTTYIAMLTAFACFMARNISWSP